MPLQLDECFESGVLFGLLEVQLQRLVGLAKCKTTSRLQDKDSLMGCREPKKSHKERQEYKGTLNSEEKSP